MIEKTSKITKKWLAGLLAALMVCAVVPVSMLVAYAADTTVDTTPKTFDNNVYNSATDDGQASQRLVLESYDKNTRVLTFAIQYRHPEKTTWAYPEDGSNQLGQYPITNDAHKYYLGTAVSSVFFNPSKLIPYTGSADIEKGTALQLAPNITFTSLSTANTNISGDSLVASFYHPGVLYEGGQTAVAYDTAQNSAVLSIDISNATTFDRFQSRMEYNSTWKESEGVLHVKFRLADDVQPDTLTSGDIRFTNINNSIDRCLFTAAYLVGSKDQFLQQQGITSLDAYMKTNKVTWTNRVSWGTDTYKLTPIATRSYGDFITETLYNTEYNEDNTSNYREEQSALYVFDKTNIDTPIVTLSTLTTFDKDHTPATQAAAPTTTNYRYPGATITAPTSGVWKLADANGNYVDKNGQATTDPTQMVDAPATVQLGKNYVRAYEDDKYRVNFDTNKPNNALTNSDITADNTTFDATANRLTFENNTQALKDGTKADNTKMTALPQLTTIGYNFNGWFSAQTGGTQYQLDTAITSLFANNVKTGTLYAQWTPKQYKVKYQFDGEAPTGATPPNETNFTVDTPFTVATAPTAAGYIFDGWKLDNQSVASGKVYTSAEIIEYLRQHPDATEITITGSWTKDPTQTKKYSVEYYNEAKTTVVDKQENVEENSTLENRLEQQKTNTQLRKKGYTLTGWQKEDNTAWDFETGTVNDTTVTGDILKLYPVYTANKYSVTLDPGLARLNAANTPQKADFTYAANGNSLTLATTSFTWEGNKFLGWSKTDNNTVDTSLKTDLNPDTLFTATDEPTDGQNITLYAVWEVEKRTVNFKNNDGTDFNPAMSFEVDYGTKLSDTTPGYTAPSKTGYTLEGWSTTQGATTGKPIGELDAVTQNITYYAVWKANTYTVKFDGNGSTGGTMADQSFTYNTAQELTANTYTRTGYTFGGWSTTANGTKVHEDKASVQNLTAEQNGTVTLYAVWTPNTYTVTFHGGAGATGAMATQSFTYDEEKALTTNAFIKDGYTFQGWSKTENGTTVDYTDGQMVRNLTDTNNGTVNLYAVWKVQQRKVDFKDTDGTDFDPAITVEVDHGSKVTANTTGYREPTKMGYTFAGWSATQNATTGGQILDQLAAITADTTYYAVWTPNQYTITFNGGTGATGTMNPQAFTYGTAQNLTKNAFTKTGYTFTGWTDENGNTYTDEQLVNNLTDVNNGTVTLTAQWAANTYTVVFNNGGGVGTMQNQSFTYDVEQALSRNTFTRVGYTFLNWQDAAGTTYTDAQTVRNLTDVANGTVTLTAQWKINTYDVTFIDVETATTLHTQTVDYNTTATEHTPAAKPGYTFNGWYTDADLTQKFAFTTPITANTTLYGKYEAIDVVITLDNGNGVTEAGGTQKFGTSYGLPNQDRLPANFIPANSILTGWKYNTTNLTGSSVVLDTTYGAETGKVTFTAVWATIAQDNVGIIYSSNTTDAVSNMPQNNTAHPIANDLTLPTEVPVRARYNFVGWATDADGNNMINGSLPASTFANLGGQTFTVYAIWEPKPFHNLDFVVDGTVQETHSVQEDTPYTVTPATPAKAGYTFVGWNTDPNGTTNTYNATTIMGQADVTFYAIFTPKQYIVEFYIPQQIARTGFVLYATVTDQLFINPVLLPAMPSVAAGQVFKGWYTQPNGQGQRIDGIALYQALVGGDDTVMTLQAYAYIVDAATDLITVNVTILDQTTPRNYPQGSTVGDVNIDDFGGVPAGYTFAGWADENGNLLPVDTPLVNGMSLFAVLRSANGSMINVKTGDQNTTFMTAAIGAGMSVLLAGFGFFFKKKKKNK